MKSSYKNLLSIALGSLLSLSLAFNANAQRRSGGGGAVRSSGGGGFSRSFSGSSHVSVAPQRSTGFQSRGAVTAAPQRSVGTQAQRQAINAAPQRQTNGVRATNTAPVSRAYTYNRSNYSTVSRSAYNGGRGTYYRSSPAAGYGTRVSGGGYGGRGGYFGNHYYYHYHNYYNSYYLPRLGFSIGFLPFGYYPFFWGDYQYYYSDGLYYRQYNDQYTVVEPPVGAEIKTLPSDAKSIMINGEQYYESNGVYYQPITKDDGTAAYVIAGKDGELNTDQGNGAVDQGPQMGDVVNQLPQDTRKIKINGEKLYVSPDGFYYQETQDNNGNVAYKIVGTPSDEPDDNTQQ